MLTLFHRMRILLPLILFFFSFYTTAQLSSHIYERLKPTANDSSGALQGKYGVYENRDVKDGRKIDLNVVVVPALHRDSMGTPIFFFEGGPGVAATADATLFEDPSFEYRQYHDIVLVDIRGTGQSNPLNCPSLQIKKNLKEQMQDMYPPEAVKTCYEELSKVADLTQYTTTNVARDVEDVRKWLGYEKINLFGLSFGTRLALVYMKMFPASVESCILWSRLPTYGKMPLYHAKFAQESMQKIFSDCNHDSACHLNFPALESEFNSLMQKFNAKGHNYKIGNENITIPWNAFQTKLRTLMYSPGGIRQIPYLIHQTYLGNLDPFIALFPKGADTTDFIAEGLYLSITCSEDVPFIQSNEIGPLTNGTFMGTYRIDQQKNACSLWARGKVPNDYFAPVKTNIPTLIFSGGFDPVTGTSMAKEIATHLSNATLEIIPQMSHILDGLSHFDCFNAICIEFINHPHQSNLPDQCIQIMQPPPYKVK